MHTSVFRLSRDGHSRWQSGRIDGRRGGVGAAGGGVTDTLGSVAWQPIKPITDVGGSRSVASVLPVWAATRRLGGYRLW
jgi:hypothetical protein